MGFVELKDICLSYDGSKNILKDLNLSIEKGELVSLLGPSGCGKTTTLRIIAGLINPNSGQFIVDSEDLTKVPVHKRNFGMVFQSYALFPHMTVFDNVAFGLKNRKMDKNMIKEKVNRILEVTDLEQFANRYPKQMSGGQRQRVALARALVVEPKLLLLDEPLSNLDAKLRISMRTEIKRIQQKLGITTVFVTHDQEECFSISDKVAVMNNGDIEQYDTPENIYKFPKTEFVARFIGFDNFFEVEKSAGNIYRDKNNNEFEIDFEDSRSRAVATIRPDDIQIVSEPSDKNIVRGTVGVRTFLGDSYQYEVMTDMGKINVNDKSDRIYQQGDAVMLLMPGNKIILV
ncbi:MAG: ABC transporter ATP-binding protein [Sedimentibacter sp.]|uniref:ABC transporter ATP-binding protein n=1 Tax=Sedimentibacter sp. TaxID=1960295 RepID=UPI0031591033